MKQRFSDWLFFRPVSLSMGSDPALSDDGELANLSDSGWRLEIDVVGKLKHE